MTPEQKSSQAVRLRAAEWGCKLFRNNSGVLPDKNNRPVRFGLANESKKLNQEFKSGDYIGVTPITITQEMVGKTIGVFTNIEVKAEGFKIKATYPIKSREYAQNNFISLITNAGGLGGFATGWAEVDLIINNFINGLKK